MIKRTSWQITRSVWHAIFLREALSRINSGRMAWLWMLVEPVAHVLLMVGVRELLGRVRLIAGADYIPWLITGIMVFLLFRESSLRAMMAIDANRGLFAYRQVKPVDTVLVRCFLEGMLKTVIFILLLCGMELFGQHILPADPLSVFAIWAVVWLLGLGVALVAAVAATIVDDADKLVRMLMLPLYLLSGAIIPVNLMPVVVQKIMLLNPLFHGIEGMRQAFFAEYQAIDGVDFMYLGAFSILMIALGLALQVKFSIRLIAK